MFWQHLLRGTVPTCLRECATRRRRVTVLLCSVATGELAWLLDQPLALCGGMPRKTNHLDTLAQDLASLATAVGSATMVRDAAVVGKTMGYGAEKKGSVRAFVGKTAALIDDALASGAFD